MSATQEMFGFDSVADQVMTVFAGVPQAGGSRAAKRPDPSDRADDDVHLPRLAGVVTGERIGVEEGLVRRSSCWS